MTTIRSRGEPASSSATSGAAGHELLEVIEDKQQLALAQEILHSLLEVAIERLPDAECGSESRGGGGAVASILKADEEGAVGEIRQEARCEREPEARLAGAAQDR